MNLRKLRLIEEAKKSFGSLSINEALLAYLRRFYDSATSVAELVSKYLRGVFNAPNFDGVDDYAVLPYRAINPDGDIDVEFYTPSNIAADGADKFIITQNIASSLAGHEFSLFIAGATGNLSLCIGGVVVAVALAGEFSASEKLRLFVTGATRSVYRGSGVLVRSGSIARGAAREPTAQTIIMARTNGSIDSLSRYAQGVQRDIKINGTLWPMADRNQAIQLPEPSGLGAEIFSNATATVSGSVTASGDFFTFNVTAGETAIVRTPSNSLTANTDYLLELEIFDHVAGNIANNTNGFVNVSNGVGKFRQVFNTGAGTRLTLGRSGSVCNFKVRNISLKPLAVAGATELVTNGDFSNGTAGWLLNNGGTLSVSSGKGTLTTVAGQNSTLGQNFTVEAGAYYEVSCDLISFTGNTFAKLSLYRGAAGSFAYITETTATTAGKMRLILIAPATDLAVRIRGDNINAGTVVVDNISLRKLDSLCNPMTLVNVTSDRWQEVAQ